MEFANKPLDFYDDPGAIRSIWPDKDTVMGIVKTASRVQRTEAHPNEFALLLIDDGKTLPRFPISDEGNTVISAAYFEKNAHVLPEQAQQVGAYHITRALRHYGYEPPKTLLKMAGDHVFSTNHVDVSSDRPSEPVLVQKETIRFAIERLDGSKHYPIDTPDQVKLAQQYLSGRYGEMTLRDRREFAINVKERASELDMSTLPVVEKLAAAHANPGLKQLISRRVSILVHEGAPDNHVASMSKLAQVADQHDPAVVAATLERLDDITGLSTYYANGVPDPFQTCFVEKVAGSDKSEAGRSWDLGTVRLSEYELRKLVEQHPDRVSRLFGNDVANRLMKDPVKIFPSLPMPMQVTLANLATDIESNGE